MLNIDLVASVTDELFWDPKVDSTAIAVSAVDGTVTLRGTVGSFREKREAKNAAERVFGVKTVDNELQVRLMNDSKRDDADLRGDILQALVLDSLVPSTVDAKVDAGFVTLSGTAEWQYQRDEAEFVAANILGVVDVSDDIELTGAMPSVDDVKSSIKSAFKRNAKIDAKDLTVETKNGTITLEGVVGSWSEHDEAIAAAWAAPGVRKVDDRILVAY
jgi:osmotically-inducible protein OsmY